MQIGERVKWSPELKRLYTDLGDVEGEVVSTNGDWLVVEVAVTDRHIPPFVVKRRWEVSPA